MALGGSSRLYYVDERQHVGGELVGTGLEGLDALGSGRSDARGKARLIQTQHTRHGANTGDRGF